MVERSISIAKTSTKKKNGKSQGYTRNVKHNNRLYDEAHVDKNLMKDNITFVKMNDELVELKQDEYKELYSEFNDKDMNEYHQFVAKSMSDLENNVLSENERKVAKRFLNSDYREVITFNSIYNEQVERYNSTQKRNDRKITNFYNECASNAKTTTLENELILTVGSKDDFKDMTDDEIKHETKLRCEILINVVKEFEDKFSIDGKHGIKIITAHLHADERDAESEFKHLRHVNPHVHLAYCAVSEQEQDEKGRYSKPSTSINRVLGELYKEHVKTTTSKKTKRVQKDYRDCFKPFRDDIVELIADNAQRVYGDFQIKESKVKRDKHLDTESYKKIKDSINLELIDREKEIEQRELLLKKNEDEFLKEREETEKEQQEQRKQLMIEKQQFELEQQQKAEQLKREIEAQRKQMLLENEKFEEQLLKESQDAVFEKLTKINEKYRKEHDPYRVVARDLLVDKESANLKLNQTIIQVKKENQQSETSQLFQEIAKHQANSAFKKSTQRSRDNEFQ